VSDDGSAKAPSAAETRSQATPAAAPEARRPIVERIGMALIALVLGLLFGTVAIAAWFGGEVFLAAMAAIGCLMTFWVGTMTLLRG
jgi:hypothetical protein